MSPETKFPYAIERSPERTVVFISKATPGDDEFVLWLAPRLEAAGYRIFADILALEPGDRWRKGITDTLQNKSVKMLLCCRDSTLASTGVEEEIGIAEDLAISLNDDKFIIPLRLENFRKVLGIGGLQYVDFVRGWAKGLEKLLETLRRQKVPQVTTNIQINLNWELYRRRGAIHIEHEPERLTSNWVRIVEVPDTIRYFEPSGATNRLASTQACESCQYPAAERQPGFFSFTTPDEANALLADIGRFSLKHEIPLLKFIQDGIPELELEGHDALNYLHSMFRQAWNSYCRNHGFLKYEYSKYAGFHASKAQIAIGRKLPWGRQGVHRSSMLRNIAGGYVWQFGITAIPAFWPYFHFKLKSRVLFAPVNGDEAGEPIDDKDKQHRLRRSICKGWRNKQWHGRMMAFLELLSGESSFIRFPLSPSEIVRIEASPILFTSPVSTVLPDVKSDEQEEEDMSTITTPDPDEEL